MKICVSATVLLTILAQLQNVPAADVFKYNNTQGLFLAASWVSGGPPGAADVAVWDAPFNSSGALLGANNLSWAGIRIAAPLNAPLIRPTNNYTLILGSAGIDMSAATQNFTIGPNITAGVSQTWTVASGRTLTLSNGTTGTGVTVTKAGAGILLFSGSATYATDVNIAAGTLQASPASGTQILSGTLSGNGQLLKDNAGITTLSGNSTFGGGTTLSAGQLNLNSPGALGTGSLTITGGALDNTSGGPVTLSNTNPQIWNSDFTFVGSANLNSGAGAVTIPANRTVNIAANTLTLGGTTTGTGNLTKSGSGTLEFAANATLTGQLLVTGGVAKISAGTVSCGGSGAALDIGSNGSGTLLMSGGALAVNGTLYGIVLGGYSGTTYGPATWTQTGGSVTAAAPSNIFTGNQAGGVTTISISGGSFTQTSGPLFIIGERANTTLSITGTAAINVPAIRFGDSSTTGATSVINLDGGTLTTGSISFASGTATLNFNGGILQPKSATTTFMAGLTSAPVRSGGALIDPHGYAITIAQPISHDSALGSTPDGGLLVNDTLGGGKLTLTGTSSYTGPTVVQTGTLAIGAAGSIAASPTITVMSGATLDMSSGVAIASGQTLQGTGTVTGPLTVGPGGNIAPGGNATATLTVTGSLTLAGDTTMQIDTTNGPLIANLITGMSQVTYGGTLHISVNGSPPTDGSSIKLFNATAYNGVFQNFDLPVLSNGLFWDVTSLAIDGTIKVSAAVQAPSFSLPSGGYVGAQSLSISSISGSFIYYTTDGSDPTTSATAQSGPTPITGIIIPTNSTPFTVKAYAAIYGHTPSMVVTAIYNTVSSPVWTSTTSGTWSNSTNWLYGAVANGSGITANFRLATLGAATTVTLDGSRTIGGLDFGDAGNLYSWTLAAQTGSVLTLDVGDGTTPAINVQNQTTTVTATLAGSHGLLKTGAGLLVAQLPNTFTGSATIRQGELRIDKTNSLGPGTITLGDAQTGTAEVRIAQRGSDPWPPTDSQCTNNIYVAAGPTGRLVIDRQNAGNYAGIYTGTVTLANNVVFRNDGGDRLSIGGKITGTGNVSLEGSRINWDSTNDFIGTVTITSGCLFQVNSNGCIPATAAVTANGTMGFNSDSATSVTIAALNGSGIVSIPYGSGNPTLTINTQSQDGSFSGAIQSRLALTKTGAGTQTLSGTNTHTGATTVTAGTLLVNGSLAAGSAVTVAAAGTLGGTGTVNGTVTAAGTLAPGGNAAGTLTTGTTVLTGSYACQLDGANCDKLAVTGNLTLTGSTLAISTLSGGATQGTYVIATYTGTRTGTFATVTGLPNGYTVNYATPNQIILVGSAGYSSWTTNYGLTGSDALPNADPDHDGIPNLMEYVLGGDPRVASTSFLPAATIVGSNLVLSYKRNDASVSDTTQTGQWSTDLIHWNNVTPVLVHDNGSAPDDMTITVPLSYAVNGRLYARLMVTQP